MRTAARPLIVAAVCLASLLSTGSGTATARDATGCFDPDRELTVEETRLDLTLGAGLDPVASQIIDRGGMAETVAAFERRLCRTDSFAAAKRLVDRHGQRLWAAAVHPGGDLPADDDRRLYWARLAATAALRQWTADFDLTEPQRAALEHRLETASRGITDVDFRRGATKVLVTGFDPFGLDAEPRRGNPSGAAALALDGRRMTIDGRTVEFQTLVLPVRYADFDAGIVEDALTPHFDDIDLFTTISQGRPGAFDLEVHNGRRRSVASIGDNNNVWGGGSPTAPLEFPGVDAGPEFLPSSLPIEAMLPAPGDYPVRRNPSVREIPAGQTEPVTRPDGPTPGSTAVEGSGGGYLSNEVAYRATLLRDRLAPALPGGHVHTPVLNLDPTNTTAITDPGFEAARTAIVSQTVALLRLAAAANTSG